MALTVTMPQLGESVTEGTIARWLKQPGEMVAKYESIAEVVTDKVNAEIPAPAEGSMGEHIAAEGAVVAVGEPICTIETAEQGQTGSAWHQADGEAAGNGAAAEEPAPPPEQPAEQAQPVAQEAAAVQPAAVQETAAPPAAAEQAPAPVAAAAVAPPASEPAGGGAEYHLTPAVRMLVREHEVDLAQVEGTGLGGRISKKDLLDYVQHRDSAGQASGAAAAQASPAPSATPVPAAAVAAEPSAQPAPQAAPGDGDTLTPLTPARRAIAEHMVRSRRTAPHAWVMMEVDMSGVARLRGARRAEFEQRYAAKLTYLPLVARAVCDALRQFPTLNASWSDEGLIVHGDLNLGIAVALEENLIVPVVRNADRLSVAGLAVAMQDLGDRARSNKLKLDEIQGGTFTLNNTGALGTVLTQAIINQPQAAILAMDAVIKRAVVVDDAIAIRPIMNLGLSFDHRINDGLQATRFLKKVKDLLETIDDTGSLM
jgi:2-oxoisovalerate dehydrogenase E2 component (dihydrolipoyl transacylase)